MNKDIVVVGSSNTDMIIKMSRIPKPGETVLGGEFASAAGGKGANQAVSAARAGGKVVFVARVGDDMLGEKALEGFVRDGINVEHVIKDTTAPSGVALIFVDEKGENSIAVASGANANVSPEDVNTARDVISSAGILLMQLETPLETVKDAARIAYENGVDVILNPAPAQTLGDDILQYISILTPNETEAELLTGITVDSVEKAEQAAKVLRERGVSTVLVTMGSQGVFVESSGSAELVPAFKVKAVDTTAAGDVFNGALAVALVEGKSLCDAVKFANAAAALSVTQLGAQPSAPKRADIETFLKNNYVIRKT
ncbi:ribokinase [Candidatus Latescibacterota bacterium]